MSAAITEASNELVLGVRRCVVAMTLLLSVQYLLGMWINLFGSFPPGSPSIGSALVDPSDPALPAHIVVAIALLFVALLAVAFAWALAQPRLRGLTLGGLLSIVVAVGAGADFVYSGYASALASFLMALGLLVAFGFYGSALAALPLLEQTPPARRIPWRPGEES